MLISIVVTTLIGWLLGDVTYNGIFSMPPDVTSVLGKVDVAGAFNIGLSGIIFSFMLVNLFDSSGTLIGVTDKAGLADKDGKFPNMQKALYVDSVSSVIGGFIGTSSVTAYIESTSGVSVGGRTGLTAVVVGLLFLLVIFLSPLAGMVPAYAVAGALIYVGVLMTSSLARVNWNDLTDAVPAFITAIMMPFSFSITDGIALGFISYSVMKLGTGRWKELNPCVILVALLFLPDGGFPVIRTLFCFLFQAMMQRLKRNSQAERQENKKHKPYIDIIFFTVFSHRFRLSCRRFPFLINPEIPVMIIRQNLLCSG